MTHSLLKEVLITIGKEGVYFNFIEMYGYLKYQLIIFISSVDKQTKTEVV
jgi:hypothetical protein